MSCQRSLGGVVAEGTMFTTPSTSRSQTAIRQRVPDIRRQGLPPQPSDSGGGLNSALLESR
jgi:hypothetical protein